jgi:hypothetical protein
MPWHAPPLMGLFLLIFMPGQTVQWALKVRAVAWFSNFFQHFLKIILWTIYRKYFFDSLQGKNEEVCTGRYRSYWEELFLLLVTYWFIR